MKRIFFFLVFLVVSVLSAAVPGKIPVQGTLMDKDGNLISDDAAAITFAIHDAETDGNELWTEERTLFVEKGKLAVYLGEIEPVTIEKIGGQEELWLSVTYDGEEMSRIQLGSVPYAHEAQMAHNAEAVGKYTETTLDEYFSSACAEGDYLRGWSGSSPICETDEGGESDGTTYVAGSGIEIDGEVISVDKSIDLYVAGTGIDIDAGTNTISINPSVYATTDHNHDGRYYLKSETYTKSDLYKKSESDGRYCIKNSDGQVTIEGKALDSGGPTLYVKDPAATMQFDGNDIDSNQGLHLNRKSTGSVSVYGNLNVANTITSTNNLSINDSVKKTTIGTLNISKGVTASDNKPFVIKKYTLTAQQLIFGYVDTAYNVSEWCPSIASYNSTYDINEDGHNSEFAYFSNFGGKIRVNFRRNWHNYDPEKDSFVVWVMFIRREFASCEY